MAPSIGTTDGSLIDGEMARFSATAASAKRPKALKGVVADESLGRLVRPASPEVLANAAEASRFLSEVRLEAAGFRRLLGALESLVCPLEPRAIKSPGGG